MPVFDAYLIVDWSANSSPKTGVDSIWYCLSTRNKGTLVHDAIRNPSTRHEAIALLRQVLRDLSMKGFRVLVGFDFPFAYPAGFAELIGLRGQTPWRLIWEELHARIIDLPDNRNNRFEVASRLNEQISAGAAPFWACPPSAVTAFLAPKKPLHHWPPSLGEYRLTDRRIRGPQSPWKLYTPGSVGGQALVGIPRVYQLRNDPLLSPLSTVWPFETSFRPLEGTEPWNILFAEVYPSLAARRVAVGEIKDRVQVQRMAEVFAGLDETGELSLLFEGPCDVQDEDLQRAESEEGWILGVR